MAQLRFETPVRLLLCFCICAWCGPLCRPVWMFSIKHKRSYRQYFKMNTKKGEDDLEGHPSNHSSVAFDSLTISSTQTEVPRTELKQSKRILARNNAGNFGDIMGGSTNENNMVSSVDSAPIIDKSQILWTDAQVPNLKNGLVTCTGTSLQNIFANDDLKLSALDRIALTANGNLQRICSSFYNAPVQVLVERCERRTVESGDLLPVWDRLVHLVVHEEVFCTASSVITVSSPHCVALVESGEVGIGQLFRYLDRLPTFSLLAIGRLENGCLWRKYILSSIELECIIEEIFSTNAWAITTKDTDKLNLS